MQRKAPTCTQQYKLKAESVVRERRVRFYLQEPEVSPRLGPKRAQGCETDRSTEATELSREERTPSPKKRLRLHS